MLYGKTKTLLLRILQGRLTRLLEDHPELLLRALRDFCSENPLFPRRRKWGQACNIGVPSEGQCILTGGSPVMVEARAM